MAEERDGAHMRIELVSVDENMFMTMIASSVTTKLPWIELEC